MKELKNAVSRRFFFSGLLALGATSLLFPQTLFADEVSDKQKEADAALSQLQSMQSSLDRASNNYYKALDEQAAAQAKMDDAQVRIDTETATIAECQSKLSTRARSMYRSGSNGFLDVLLGSESFESFATNWDILNQLNDDDAALVQEAKVSRAAISDAKATYAVQREEATRTAEEAQRVQADAMSTVSQMQSVYQSLSAEAAALVAQNQASMQTVTDQATLSQLAEQGAIESSGIGAGSSSGSESAAGGGGSTAGGSTDAGGSSGGGSVNVGGGSIDTGGGSVDSGGGSVDSGGSTDTGSDTGSSGGSDFGSTVVSIALSYLGWDYVWGGKSPSAGGFDCSGFVSWCYSQAGGYAPSWTGSLINWGYQVWNPQPGDVCVVHQDWDGGNQHTGIYYQNGQMIHAAWYGIGVIIGNVQSGMQYRRNY